MGMQLLEAYMAYKLIRIYVCPSDVQCGVMCKGSIPLNFIVYSFLAQYNGIAFLGTIVNGISTFTFFYKDHLVPIFFAAGGVKALAGVLLQYMKK